MLRLCRRYAFVCCHKKLVDYCNANGRISPLEFYQGFPENKRGCGNLKKLIPAICNMAKANLHTFILTDLDSTECAPELIRQWFNIREKTPKIPDHILFRVAKREVEAWLLADGKGLSSFLEIPATNFPTEPDTIEDPKQCLLNIIRSKGRKKFHREMLPEKNAHVGPEYNVRLCQFVQKEWNITIAREKSESLSRTVTALCRF